MLRRFRREAEIASRLDHPGICGVLEAGEIEGVPYIMIFEYDPRGNLDLVIDARRP
ncbi:MAG: hypothetical protein HY717_23190 [Planctomycetes bacterium]|nr:hypothetical protein [Planctomycetota bacterium]